MKDGFKPVQRKIIWVAMQTWKYSNKKPIKKKVGIFGGSVMEKTEYHHGPYSLSDAIVKMTWNFCGSNNVPYFFPSGQSGPDMNLEKIVELLVILKHIHFQRSLTSSERKITITSPNGGRR